MSNNLNAAGLISSLPAILGYQVTDSIVAVMLKRHDGQEVIDVVLRVSIDCSTEEIATMPQAAARSARNTAGAILIAVAGGDHDTHAGDLLDALRNSLIDLDIPVQRQRVAFGLQHIAGSRLAQPDQFPAQVAPGIGLFFWIPGARGWWVAPRRQAGNGVNGS